MHYYQFNIGDWMVGTSHLSLEEEAIYLRLINHYYNDEKLIPLETHWVIRRLRLGTDEEIVESVLNEFFIKTDKGWEHKRCEEMLKAYRKTVKKNRANGMKGGRPRKDGASKETEKKPTGLPLATHSQPTGNPNQEPITKNHKPETNNHKPTTKQVDKTPVDVLEIFTYWFDVMKKNSSAKCTPKRTKAVKGRLSEGYSTDDLKAAIFGCSVTPHNIGQNDQGKRFDCLELICRSGEHVERFIANGKTMSPTEQRVAEVNDWVNGTEQMPLSTYSEGETIDHEPF